MTFFNRGKYAVGSLKKKMSADNPHVAMFALQVISSLPLHLHTVFCLLKEYCDEFPLELMYYIQMKYDRMCAVEFFYKDA